MSVAESMAEPDGFDDEYFDTVPLAALDWRKVPAEDAPQRWAELREWVQWLKDRYSLDHRVVPPCWYLHDGSVDLLTALRDRHRADHDTYAAAAGPADWQLAFRMLEQRLRDWASRTGCTRDEHRPDVGIDWPEDDERWTQHIAADIQARTHSQARTASPT
jgi:hypothetical protein